MLNDKCPECNQFDGHHKHCSIGISLRQAVALEKISTFVDFVHAEREERLAQEELDKLDAP